jgi:hypothetical protein
VIQFRFFLARFVILQQSDKEFYSTKATSLIQFWYFQSSDLLLRVKKLWAKITPEKT